MACLFFGGRRPKKRISSSVLLFGFPFFVVDSFGFPFKTKKGNTPKKDRAILLDGNPHSNQEKKGAFFLVREAHQGWRIRARFLSLCVCVCVCIKVCVCIYGVPPKFYHF